MAEPHESQSERPDYVGKLIGLRERLYRDTGPDRALRAQLRRCKTADDALFAGEGDAWRLVGQPKGAWFVPVMIAAIVMAHLKKTEGIKLASKLGHDGVCSQTRFRQLLLAKDVTELLPHLRRALKLAGEAAQPHDLARSILNWTDETKRRWAFDYFQASNADPDVNEKSEQPSPNA
ncbi:MAG TPA: type I-E CRISPR-associated protein Cse2/CasB [Alphaproteobacteria bacterium]|nr:type I-E CRISPR-associated protein Cse2/CasB [Alphaproteobacteria bacterium]